MSTAGHTPFPRIEDHALLSNCQGSALVTGDGTIDWACLPRFDSPACFAALLDPDAGHWTLRPEEAATPTRRYLPTSMVLATTWRTDGDAEVEVWDMLPFGPDERGHRIGKDAPPAIVRVVHGRAGSVPMRTELTLRPEYGLVTPLVIPVDGGALMRGGASSFVVSSPVPLRREHATAAAAFTVAAGETAAFMLLVTDPWDDPPPRWTQPAIVDFARSTVEAWQSWSRLHQGYEGSYADLVTHSGRVLQALTYAPSGAVVAAATTSLPETLGGRRNWDYRFSWLRDASLTLDALWVAACPDEAHDLFRFFATAAGTQLDGTEALPIMYGIGGERHLPEVELDHLRGYEGSRPVRIGNGAWRQTQLDVYGEVLAAACRLRDQIEEFDGATAAFLVRLADAACDRWQEPDHGIWEIRGEPRHYTYSKLMCWVALDRAVQLAPHIGGGERADDWAAARDEVASAIVERSWSEGQSSFAMAFGSDELDAATLMMPIVEFLPADHPKMRATIEAVAEHLTDDHGFVYRYRCDDGLDGEEGTFTICTFWLAHCFALLGDLARARSLFDRLVAYANDVGLLAEEVDAATGRQLGNFPQAFTHIGLVNAAWAIHLAEQKPR